MPAPVRRRRRLPFLLALLAGVGVAWAISAFAVLWFATRDHPVRSDAIVVLGAAHYQGRPSPVLRARLDHAVRLYARGLAPRLVLTGGIAEGDTASEAAVSRTYVMRAGVPDSAILLENEGRTTSQSLQAVGRMLKARRLTTVVVVSDPFHMLRVRILAGRQGLEVTTSPTTTRGILGRLARQPEYFLGETVKAPLAALLDW